MAVRHRRLVFIAGIIGTAHHYYWIVSRATGAHRRDIQRTRTAGLVGMDVYAYRRYDARVSASEHFGNALDSSSACSHSSEGLLGLAHTGPASKVDHGTINRHAGHAAFYGAYAMIVMAMISYALPVLCPQRRESGTTLGYWAFWLQIVGMFGMTLSFATAGIGQVYLERILGLGYLDTQLKIQVHFLMLVATGSIFAVGVAAFIVDFFRYPPKFVVTDEKGPELNGATLVAARA